jgi:hypothetical protein
VLAVCAAIGVGGMTPAQHESDSLEMFDEQPI